MRPVSVSAGPFTAVATAVALAQTATGAGELAINGTLATAGWIGTGSISGTILTTTANTQGAVSAGGVTFPSLSGLGVAAGTVVLGPGPGAVANTWIVNISQTVASRTLYTGAVAKLATPGQITVTDNNAADTGLTVTLTGTDWAGDVISETLAVVANGTATSVLSYATVTQVVISGATTGTVSVGTAAVGSSQWVRLDEFAPGPISVTLQAVGTVTYSVQQSNQDPNSPTNPVAPSAMLWVSSNDASAVGATTSLQSSLINQPLWARVIVTAGSGSVNAVFSQNSAVPY